MGSFHHLAASESATFRTSEAIRSGSLEAECLIVWACRFPENWMIPVGAENVTVTDQAGLRKTLALAHETQRIVVVVLDRAASEQALAELHSRTESPPILALIGTSRTPLAIPTESILLSELPSTREELTAFLDSVRRLASARRRKLLGALQSFSSAHCLSPQERRLLDVSIRGFTNDEASTVLGCSRPTVSTYWNRIFKKVGVNGQREILAAFVRHAVGEPEESQFHREKWSRENA